MARANSDDDSSEEIETETEHIENPDDVEPSVDVDAVEVNDPVNERIVAEALKPAAKARRAALPYDGDDSEREEPESQNPFLQADPSNPSELDESDGSGEDDAGSEAVEADGGRVYPVHCGDRRSYDATEPVQPVTTGESVASLYGRVVRVEDAGPDWSDDRELYLADPTGTTRVRLHGQLESPELRPGEHVVVTDVENDGEEGGAKFEQTAETDVVAIGRNRQTPGYWMRERSRLIKAEAWYSDEKSEDWEAEEIVKNTILDEYAVETPRGQDDVMMMYIDAPGSDLHGTWTHVGEDIIRSMLDKHLPEWKNSQRTKNSIVCSLRDRTRVPEDEWDEGAPESEELRWSVGVDNGVIDLRTGELRDHGPEWRLRSKLPVEYHPDEYDGLGDEFDWFLSETMQGDADRESFLYLLGHALARCYPDECVWSLTGPGGNGKTRLLEAIDALFGGTMNDFSLQTMAGDYDFGAAPLKGANIVIDDDATAVKLNNTEDMKKHSGGRGGQVNVKREKIDGDGYRNYATIAFLSNDPPMFGDQTEGMKRRMFPVIMPYQFSNNPADNKKDAVPKEEIRRRIQADDELEALLAVAVEYAGQIHANGKVEDGRTADERWDVYNKYSDAILRFWRDCMQQDTGARVTRNAVYEVYVQWCERNGVDPQNSGGTNGFWPLSDQCHDISFNRDSVWLDGDRAVEHVKFDPDAMDHAPEWVREKWEADVDEEDSVLANRLDRTTPLADLDGGYCTVEARVISRDYADTREEAGVELTLEDGTTAIDAITWGDEFDGVHVGDKVRFERAVLSQHRSVPQLKIKNATAVEVVESGPNARSDAVEDDSDDDGDGDGESDRSIDLVNDDWVDDCETVQSIEDVIVDTVEAMGGDDAPEDSAVIGRIVGEHDVDKEKVEYAAEQLMHSGDLYEPETGHWRCT